ncbi:unnamed protein product [Kuraishia capsulata CBS 1993]|uniref:SUN-like protein 1 n=1 Tax=Kuraishia capsulata CBS 1993 TaxID=1382522 RepID=W6MKL2_9ASCO|nr:uncharacterized protein KUCA_T00002903001 [Kuraishia capsulata CBS 1993]CDK26926.1 unnamed protein product [Kuraishia capsulata CBS 1993]
MQLQRRYLCLAMLVLVGYVKAEDPIQSPPDGISSSVEPVLNSAGKNVETADSFTNPSHVTNNSQIAISAEFESRPSSDTIPGANLSVEIDHEAYDTEFYDDNSSVIVDIENEIQQYSSSANFPVHNDSNNKTQNETSADLENDVGLAQILEMTAGSSSNLSISTNLTEKSENGSLLSQNETTHNDLIGSFDEALTNLTGTSDSGLLLNGSEKADDEADVHFMSFEEWKRKNALENPVVKEKTKAARAPTTTHQSAHFVGPLSEEIEIPLDLFGGEPSQVEDEGGKIYKDRFNYASFDCAATIMKTNSEAKGASAILNENKDSYLLNECVAPNKFVVIELCEDILVDTVLLGNYEFFSSSFKTIRLSVSDRFPVPQNGWKVLGEFEAENIRDLQSFTIKNPLIWARYLRLEVLSYFGGEYYCPLSAIRVYGKTMMEEFKLEEEKELSGVADEEAEEEVEQIENAQDSPASDILLRRNSSDAADLNSSVIDMEQVATLDEDCSVALMHLGLEQFLEERSADDFCIETDFTVPSMATDHPAQEPTTQESIYKSIVKRLSLLESNASLSLLYIEEQSKLLSKAFEKMEKRQITKFDLLVSAFNISIHSQLSQLKSLYTSFQDDTLVLLNDQRRKHAELLTMSASEVDSLASQLAAQKRLGLLNSIVLICLLIYIVVTRDTFIEAEVLEDQQFDDSQSSHSARSDSPSPIISSPSSTTSLPKKRHKIRLSIGHKIARSYSDYFYDKSSQQQYVYSQPTSLDGGEGIRVELNPIDTKFDDDAVSVSKSVRFEGDTSESKPDQFSEGDATTPDDSGSDPAISG